MRPFDVIARVKNMTRETKLGLVVSCSFLGLLAAVLGMKMTEHPEDAAGPEVATAAQDGPPPAGPSDAAASGAAGQAAPAPGGPSPPAFPKDVPAKQIILTGGTAPPAANGKSGGNGLPPLPPVSPAAPLAANDKTGGKGPPSGSGDGLPPIPAPAAVKEDDTGKPAPASGGGLLSGLWSAFRRPAALAAKSAPKKDPDGKGGNKPLARGNSDPPPVAAPDPSRPAPSSTGGAKLPEVPPLPALPAAGKTGEAPSQKGGGTTGGGSLPALPPIAPLPEKKDTGTIAAPPPLPPVEPSRTGTGGGAAAAMAPLRPVPAAPLPPVVLADPAADKGGSSSPPRGAGVKPAPAAETGKTPTFDVGNISGGTGGRVPPVKEPEPIAVGRPPSAAVPPLPVAVSPARPAQPDVVSYTEETYVANADDTYQSISRLKYGTDSYAQALYLFNRSHPLAADEVLQSKAVKPKQPIYLPPAEILESRYPGAVSGPKAAAGAGVTIGTTSQRPSAAPRTYRVAAGGEKLYDIAARLLGDGNRWGEIRDENPGWNPALPIPAGTTLTLPAGARLPQ